MNTYLVIITTVLVLTQIIRLIQNSMQLKRLNGNKQKENDIVLAWERMAEAIDNLIEELRNNRREEK